MQKDKSFEMYDYARKRIKQKKILFFHFIVFVLGSLLLYVFNTFIQSPSSASVTTVEPVGVESVNSVAIWWPYVVGIWALALFFHAVNVLVVNRFMGQRWQDKEIQRLVLLQERKIDELRKKVEKDYPLVDVKRDLNQGE